MNNDLYRCAAVFSSKNILVYKNDEYFQAIISNKISNQVLVGDYLLCEFVYDNLYVSTVVNRKNSIQRLQSGKIQCLAANVDIIFIVTSANQDFNIARLERYYIIAKESKARLCFVLSKIDLNDECEKLSQLIVQRFPNCSVEKTSIYSDEFTLYNHWNENETAVFLGSSGVGKSSLINYMLKDEIIKTQAIRDSDGHGKHTTSVRHMYVLPNNRVVIDTPGLRSVGISAKVDTIDELFPEIKELEIKCKYSNCSHIREPGCAIKASLDNDELDYERYLRYLKLVGDENKRRILLSGKTYQKEQIMKDLKSPRKK